jgi:hypothetical protein
MNTACITVEIDLTRVVAESRAREFGPEAFAAAHRRRDAARLEYLTYVVRAQALRALARKAA